MKLMLGFLKENTCKFKIFLNIKKTNLYHLFKILVNVPEDIFKIYH